MDFRTHVLMALLLWPAAVPAQRVSFGFIGGTNLTRDFPISRTIYQDDAHPAGLTTFDLYSDSKSFIAGPTIEFSLSKQLALEANALHRNLNLKSRFAFPDGQKQNNDTSPIGTWE